MPRLLAACRRQPVDRPPIWLMRQAGRYLPEYRALRQRYDFLTLLKTPELAAEVTLQPLRRFPLDAAIVFADILLPLEAMGLALSFVEGEGPRLAAPVTSAEDVDRLRPVEPRRDLGYVLDTIRLVRRSRPDVPVIGFAGAPFTLLCYMVEGQGSRDFALVKSWLWRNPALSRRLLALLADLTRRYLEAQVEAGAQVLQLFDSWAGILSEEDFRDYVLPQTQALVRALRRLGVPVIYFSLGTTSYLASVAEVGADVLSLDWRLPLTLARRQVPGQALQGNLDPSVLLADADTIRGRARALLAAWGDEPGLVVNLGHGVDPRTPPEHVGVLVDAVARRS